jgi:hypothetical protein
VGQEVVVEDLIDAGNAVVVRLRAHLSVVQSGLQAELQLLSPDHAQASLGLQTA